MGFFSSADDVPTLQQLQQLQGKDNKTVRVIDTVAHEWEELAIAMGFQAHVIATIRRENIRDVKEATRQILTLWLEGECSEPVSWGTLVESLHTAGFSNVAFDVQELF